MAVPRNNNTPQVQQQEIKEEELITNPSPDEIDEIIENNFYDNDDNDDNDDNLHDNNVNFNNLVPSAGGKRKTKNNKKLKNKNKKINKRKTNKRKKILRKRKTSKSSYK